MIEFDRKKEILLQYAETFNIKTMVETGTYAGDMIEACLFHFDIIYSIELSKILYKDAVEKFKSYNHVILLQGDSGVILKTVIKQLKYPSLFWLDAHYSGETTVKGNKNTPIREELNCIFNSSLENYIILIDDARCFGRDKDYPSISEIIEQARNNGKLCFISEDIIRIIS